MIDIDSIALKISRRIMLDIRTDTIPVDVRKIGQLQAKIQCVLEEYIREQQAEITRLNYLVASLKETMEIMQDIIDTEKLKGVE